MPYIDPSRGEGVKVTPEYNAWKHMKGRCNNPNDAGYSNYGGRGIRVCSEWSCFDQFLSDVGPRPSPQHSLERTDVNGDYEPGNVIWATKKEQMGNTRRSLKVDGLEDHTSLLDYCKHNGFAYETVKRNVRKGIPLAEAHLVRRKPTQYYEYRGERYSAGVFAKKFGLRRSFVRGKLSQGYTLENIKNDHL